MIEVVRVAALERSKLVWDVVSKYFRWAIRNSDTPGKFGSSGCHFGPSLWGYVAALTMSSQQEFDLVAMDMQIPLMDGPEATQKIRLNELGTGRRLPIIAITANANWRPPPQML
jgi:CheY-like chemotaxis protein